MSQIQGQAMTVGFPVILSLAGAVADFFVWAKLRHFKVREKSPASRTGLSVEERQRKITVAARIVLGSAWFFLLGALLLLWLENSK
jgi:hypothetical protein